MMCIATEYAEEGVEEWEATALNALGDLAEDNPEVDHTTLGEGIELEPAAVAAFGKIKGQVGSQQFDSGTATCQACRNQAQFQMPALRRHWPLGWLSMARERQRRCQPALQGYHGCLPVGILTR